MPKILAVDDHAEILTIIRTKLERNGYEVETLSDSAQVMKKIDEFQPDLVLLPNSLDIHQDHHTIYQEGLRAFKHTRMLGYELPWNNLNFTNNCHIRLEREHIQAKMDALQCYQSQNFRNYMDPEYFFGLAKTRGIQINSNYAEAFELIRWII